MGISFAQASRDELLEEFCRGGLPELFGTEWALVALPGWERTNNRTLTHWYLADAGADGKSRPGV